MKCLFETAWEQRFSAQRLDGHKAPGGALWVGDPPGVRELTEGWLEIDQARGHEGRTFRRGNAAKREL